MRIWWLPILVVFLGCESRESTAPGSSEQYLGQTPPGLTAELFGPGSVSTGDGELNAILSSDLREFYFTRRGVPGIPARIMVTRQSPEGWTVPEPVPFDERFSAIDLFITPDGQRMIFCSNRPLDEMDPAKGDHDFWISTRNEDGWSDPEVFAPAALSAAEDFYPIVTGSGNLYFNSQREGPGTNNIFRSRWGEGGYEPAEKLPAPINTRFREFDAFVSGAEDLILFSSERPGGYGGPDIYLSVLDDGGWSEPRNLGDGVNSEASEYGAVLSPDGQYLFFTSSRSGSEDIYWVSAEVLGEIGDEPKVGGDAFQ